MIGDKIRVCIITGNFSLQQSGSESMPCLSPCQAGAGLEWSPISVCRGHGLHEQARLSVSTGDVLARPILDGQWAQLAFCGHARARE